MKLYQIVFDIRGDVTHDYSKFYDYMCQFENIQVCEHSFWFLSNKSVEELAKDIDVLMYKNPPTTDFFYIMEISPNVNGMLVSSCWKWLKEKLKEEQV